MTEGPPELSAVVLHSLVFYSARLNLLGVTHTLEEDLLEGNSKGRL